MSPWKRHWLWPHDSLLTTVHKNATEQHKWVIDLERKLEDSPSKSYYQVIQEVTDDFRKLKNTLKRSTIPKGHQIRRFESEINGHIMDLHSTECPMYSLDTSSASDCSSSQLVKQPKLALPTFKGDPMQWSVFWEQFSSAVHNNSHLDNSQKLTYLREAVKDPKATPLLF